MKRKTHYEKEWIRSGSYAMNFIPLDWTLLLRERQCTRTYIDVMFGFILWTWKMLAKNWTVLSQHFCCRTQLFFKVTSNLHGATLVNFFLVKKIKVREAQVCTPWTLKVLLFHWLVAFQVDTFLCEGMICLWIFRRRKLALVFRENPFSLDELIGYADLTVFHEIWSEHSLIDMEQKVVGEFLFFKYFPCGGLQRNTLREFFDSRTWQIYKKITNRNKRKCWHVFGDWGFVINTAQLFCMNDRIWYPINSLERQSVFLELMASADSGKQNPKQNIILSNSTFYNLYVDI